MTLELQEAANSGATGVLSILTSAPVVTGGIFFQDGNVVAAAVNGRTPALGRRLVGTGLVDPMAIERLFPPGGADINPQVGAAAVRAGFMEQGVLEAVHLEYLVDDLDVLLASNPSESKFHVGREPDRFAVSPIPLSTVLRTLDERRDLCGQVWSRLGMNVGPDQTVPHLTGLPDGCSTFAQALAAWLDGSRTLTEAALDSGFSRFEAIVLVGELVNAGVVQCEVYVPQEVDAAPPVLSPLDPNMPAAPADAFTADFAMAQFNESGLEDTNAEEWTASFALRDNPVTAPLETVELPAMDGAALATPAVTDFGAPSVTEYAVPAVTEFAPPTTPDFSAPAVAEYAPPALSDFSPYEEPTPQPQQPQQYDLSAATAELAGLAAAGDAFGHEEFSANAPAPSNGSVPPLAPPPEAATSYDPAAFAPPTTEFTAPPAYAPPAFEAPSFSAPAYEPPAYDSTSFTAPAPTTPTYEPVLPVSDYAAPPAYEPEAFAPPAPPAFTAPAPTAPAYEPPTFAPPPAWAQPEPSYSTPEPSYTTPAPSYDAPASPWEAAATEMMTPAPVEYVVDEVVPQQVVPEQVVTEQFISEFAVPAAQAPVAPAPVAPPVPGAEFKEPPSPEVLDAAVAAASARAVAAARQRRLSASTRFALLVAQDQTKRADAAAYVEKQVSVKASIEEAKLLRARLEHAQARVISAQQATSEATLQLLTAQQAEALWKARVAQVASSIDASNQRLAAVEDQLVMAQNELNARRAELLSAEENLRVSKNNYEIAQMRHKSAAIDVVAARMDNQQVRDRKVELEAAYAAAVDALRQAESNVNTTASEHSTASQEVAALTNQLAALQATLGDAAFVDEALEATETDAE
jgi:hypothetical protein